MKKMMMVLLVAAALLMGMNALADTWTTRDEASFGRYACQADCGYQNCRGRNCGAERCGETCGWNGSCLNNSVCRNDHHRNHCANGGYRRGCGR